MEKRGGFANFETTLLVGIVGIVVFIVLAVDHCALYINYFTVIWYWPLA